MKELYILGTFIPKGQCPVIWVAYKEENEFLLTQVNITSTEEIHLLFKIANVDIRLNHENSKTFREFDGESYKDCREYSNNKLEKLNSRSF